MIWECGPLWRDEPAAFIIGGGPSVKTQDLSLLRGRKVIVINSSVYAYPDADLLFFGDARWWREVPENQKAVDDFKGKVVTTAHFRHAKIKFMNKVKPPGLSKDRRGVMVRRTSLTGAINLAVHLGVKTICLLGADGKKEADGTTHHHKPHKWKSRPGCWDEQKKDLVTIVKPLADLGVRVFNASPGSAWADLWPATTLTQFFHDQINCLSSESIGHLAGGDTGKIYEAPAPH